MFLQPCPDEVHRVVLNRLVFYRRIHIIENGIQHNPPFLYGFKAKQGVIDTPQFAGSDKDKRIFLLGNVVYCQKLVGALFVVYFWNLDQKLMGWLYKQVNTMFDRKPTDIKF